MSGSTFGHRRAGLSFYLNLQLKGQLISQITKQSFFMKKVFFTVASLLCITMMVEGTSFGSQAKSKPLSPKKNCVGYTIIAVDRGVNCDGDTVMLTKIHGYYEIENSK
jgi:hypothetical protein